MVHNAGVYVNSVIIRSGFCLRNTRISPRQGFPLVSDQKKCQKGKKRGVGRNVDDLQMKPLYVDIGLVWSW